ncbi:MAG: nucleoside monophosphate kinase [bacterium]
MEELTVIFLGPQGSGKGTQVALLKEYIAKNNSRSIVYFTAGTNLRAFATNEGYTQEKIRPLISAGKLIPTFITTELFSSRLIGSMHGNEHIILDGFPRTIDQTPTLDTALQFYGRKNVTVLSFTLSDAVARERLSKRDRGDDTEEGIEERLRWSHQEGALVSEWFKANSFYRYIEINGEGPVEEVHRNVLTVLGFS